MITLESDLRLVDHLVDRIAYFLSKDKLFVNIDGQDINGYRSPDAKSIWIRDYSDIIRGARYYEADVKSVVQHFADTQAANGRVFDYFTCYAEKLPCERENWTKYVRVPVEADVEYRFVKAAWVCYQACGDKEWLISLLPKLEKAIHYSMNDPQRWDSESELIKRPYTIDTWDFAYTAGKHEWLQFQIDKNTYWGIFHGDNSGLYEALLILSDINYMAENEKIAMQYQKLASKIKIRLNKICWNGRFYDHFKKISDVSISEVDESSQLSLSNPISINRGLGDHEKAAAMIREYQFRADSEDVFAPWFSIHPPFPDGIFGDEKLIGGAYINGGLFPLVGGELALMAFENGFESYGFDQIMKYENLTENNETYLWYFPDGSPSSTETSTSPDATPTDGWGSSAFLMAIIQGLAGIKDMGHSLENINFSPRWAAATSRTAKLKLNYPASDSFLEYQYSFEDDRMIFKLTGHFENINAHIFIPEHCRPTRLLVNEVQVAYKTSEVNESKYIDFTLSSCKTAEITIYFDIIRI